jgi:hypothetical protein
MSLRKAVYDILNDIEADVYPFVAPQELTDPYVVYSMRVTPVRVQEGIIMSDVDLSLYIYANTIAQVAALSETIYAALEDKTGTFDSEVLHVSNYVSEDGDYIPDLDKYLINQEYNLRFT